MIDRPAAIRAALRDLVATQGLHGASMNAIAKAAGVATGTAYVHYPSKDDLVVATFVEVKHELAEAVLAGHDPSTSVFEQYRRAFMSAYRFLRAVPARANFVIQVECSPYRTLAHDSMGDQLQDALLPAFGPVLIDVPLEVLWAMSLGVAVQLAAQDVELADEQLETVVAATWRAITRP